MNGSEAIVHTLLANDVKVCFANPGTSEMHFVSALDTATEMRCVLGLFEGVVTGAADGYYRMADKPAATLLHLGPGLGNGLANLHNAKRARSGIINIVGQHALDHIANDAPLTSDIEGIAKPMSHWVRTSMSAQTAPFDTAAAVAEAAGTPGKIATLILPADAAWGKCTGDSTLRGDVRKVARAADENIEAIARLLGSNRFEEKSVALLLGGRAMRSKAARLAGQIAARTGCRLLSETKNARSERGVGRVNIPQLPYPIDAALDALKDIRLLILVGAASPVAFFAYPGKPRLLTQPGSEVHTLATPFEDIEDTLQALCDSLGASSDKVAYVSEPGQLGQLPTGKPDSKGLGLAIATLLPENAIVVDEAITTGRQLHQSSIMAAPHDWLEITGGSIGYGLPAAVGAAIACPDRKVIAIEGDGSAMYTVQSLWTMARENLDITVVICANRSYQILSGELANMGGPAPGPNARRMLTLGDPILDWVSLAKGHGMAATKVDNLADFCKIFARSMQAKGPSLIEVWL